MRSITAGRRGFRGSVCVCCVTGLLAGGYLFSDQSLVCYLLCSACCAYAVPFYRGARDNLFERGKSACSMLILSPLSGFLSRSLFHTIPSLGGTRQHPMLPRFHAPDPVYSRPAEHRGNVQGTTVLLGGWGRRKVGVWGRKPGRGRGISMAMRPPSLGLSPQAAGKTVLRRNSTQSIRKHMEENGHFKKRSPARRP